MNELPERPFSSLTSTLEKQLVNYRFLLLILTFSLIAYGLAKLGGKALPDIALGVGTGTLSSLIVVWLYGRIAEERAMRRISRDSAIASASETHNFLYTHFEQVVPKKTYPRTSAPTEDFRRDFAPNLETSSIYLHRGSDAGFAAFRIYSLAHLDALKTKVRITFCILDPRATDALWQRARLEIDANQGICSDDEIRSEAEKIRTEIYISLEALFSVRHSLSIQVVFHRDSPFFRAEVFDKAIFISYYLGGEYPGTYQFGNSSYVYKAFQNSINLLCHKPSCRINIDSALTAGNFSNYLHELGFDGSLMELEKMREEKFSLRLKSLPPFSSPNQLF